MQTVYTSILRLDIISTGESIIEEPTSESAKNWHKYICKKVLSDKRRAEEVRKAILANDVTVAWADFDLLVSNGIPLGELKARSKIIWKGLDEDGFIYRATKSRAVGSRNTKKRLSDC
jgi:hypothetical protein